MRSIPRLNAHFKRRRKKAPSGIVYLAAPKDIFFCDHYQSAVRAAKGQFRHLMCFEPAREYTSSEDWRDHWPGVLSDIKALAVCPRANHSIGAGCWKEITDCRKRRIPVFIFHRATRSFRPLLRMTHAPASRRSLANWGSVYGGRR